MRLTGIVGWPIAQTRSPAMQNAAFAALGLPLVYRAFAVPPSQLAVAVDGARALGARGLNLTVPHKEAALPLCISDAQARAVGAVNTLVFDDDATRGYNTDVFGFEQLVGRHCAEAARGRVVVLGAGGAARAVAAALLPTARTLIFYARQRRSVVVDDTALDVRPWSTLDLRATDLLVDATSRVYASVAESLDLSPLPAHAVAVDLTVKRSTPFLDAARARGLRGFDGSTMLLEQGARAFTLWTDLDAPRSVMRQALDATL